MLKATFFPAGPASAIDFQQPLALPPLAVERARVAEDGKSAAPAEAIGNLTATPAGPADIADVVNPANPDSPASDIANTIVESVQSGPNKSQQALSDALGNPVQEVAPKLQDALEQPAELLKPGREVRCIRCCFCEEPRIAFVKSPKAQPGSTVHWLSFDYQQLWSGSIDS